MNSILFHLKKLDWIMIVSAVLLVCVGLISIYSSSSGKGDFSIFKKQIIFSAIGFILMFLISFFDWRYFREDSYLILILYILSLAALIGLFFFAPEIRGTKSWYKLGPVSVDPIEFIKIILIVMLAKYFSMRHIEMYRIRNIALSGLYVLIPSILIFFQPNLGSVIILTLLWLSILIVSGVKIRHFLLLGFIGILVFIFSWSFLLKDYQKARVLSFIQPQAADTLTIGWNQRQAKIAVGSGGLSGQGIGKGSQTQYGFLPEAQTDFVFAAWAEETGLAGVTAVFLLFAILFWRIIKIANLAKSNFPRLFASGLAIVLIVQVFINIGMNIGILPIIGIPLPFLSYGGNGLVSTFLALGILQSIKNRLN